jgi:hypothetical protein
MAKLAASRCNVPATAGADVRVDALLPQVVVKRTNIRRRGSLERQTLDFVVTNQIHVGANSAGDLGQFD